jgi:hypothetical protein
MGASRGARPGCGPSPTGVWCKGRRRLYPANTLWKPHRITELPTKISAPSEAAKANLSSLGCRIDFTTWNQKLDFYLEKWHTTGVM